MGIGSPTTPSGVTNFSSIPITAAGNYRRHKRALSDTSDNEPNDSAENTPRKRKSSPGPESSGLLSHAVGTLTHQSGKKIFDYFVKPAGFATRPCGRQESHLDHDGMEGGASSSSTDPYKEYDRQLLDHKKQMTELEMERSKVVQERDQLASTVAPLKHQIERLETECARKERDLENTRKETIKV